MQTTGAGTAATSIYANAINLPATDGFRIPTSGAPDSDFNFLLRLH